jgi:charged multivesicular body protein 7
LTAKDSIYNPGWLPGRIAAFVIGKPLWWSLEQLGIVGDEGLLGSSTSGSHKDTGWWGDYVVVSLLEKAADEVLRIQREKAGGAGDRLYTFEGFRRAFGSVQATETPLTEGDAKVLLRFLERDRKTIVFDGKVYLTICLAVPGLLSLQTGGQVYCGRDFYCT